MYKANLVYIEKRGNKLGSVHSMEISSDTISGLWSQYQAISDNHNLALYTPVCIGYLWDTNEKANQVQ